MVEKQKERRRSANKTVETLWQKGSEDEELKDRRNCENDGITVREKEAKLVAQKFELKRKISGAWLEKCNHEEKETS